MSVIKNRPNFHEAEAKSVFEATYDLQVATLHALDGERDQNLRVLAHDGGEFVFKICNSGESRELLAVQNAAMAQLCQTCDFVPRLLTTRDGDALGTIAAHGKEFAVRTVTFLRGQPLAHLARPSRYLLEDFGHKLARLDSQLQGLDHPVLHRQFDWNLLRGSEVVLASMELIEDEPTKQLVAQFMKRIGPRLHELGPQLRQSMIHNDANDFNVIVSDRRDRYGERMLSGIIDFGDMAWSYVAAELAIALAYVVCRRTDWLTAACELTRGYHAQYPLTEVELGALFDLMLLRLCTSVCMSARQQRERPDDPYLSVSQEPIRAVLPRLAETHPRFVECRLRDACGLPPHPASVRVAAWIALEKDHFLPVMGTRLTSESVDAINLDVANPDIRNDQPTGYHQEPLDNHSARRTAIGGYNEARSIYSNERFVGQHIKTSPPGSKDIRERRTIHLGIDISSREGTAVYAPLDGLVVINENRNEPQDYGGLIVLRHVTDQGDPFYTLFGHLSLECLERAPIGHAIQAGHEVGRLGTALENGGWFPHLHFQLIVDLLDLDGEFPGVGLASERAVWTSLSPNPCDLIGVDDRLRQQCQSDATKSDVAATLSRRRQRLGPNLSTAYREPLKIVRGRMQYLIDHTGRQFLDAYNNVPHVGHCHPRITAAATRQIATLNTNTRYLHELLNEYTQRLCATLPDSLTVCYLLNSASEANELALRMARAATGRQGVIVQEGAYHGHTTTLIDVSPYKHDGPGGQGAPVWVTKVPLPDRFRGQFRGDEQQCGQQFAEHAANIIVDSARGEYPPAAFLAETCPSVGGQIMPPANYLPLVYEAARGVRAVTIADEVQTGLGRLGTHFWAFERYHVTPDIVVIGKPLGNGHPLAAVVTTRAIADAFDNGMEFFSTFGGNTVSCAVGLAVLDVLADENLQAKALSTGQVLEAGFRELQAQYEIIGDVRGSGLFWGLELVRDKATLEPADSEATLIANRMRERGVLIGIDGPLHNVLKIRPPMPFDAENAQTLLAVLDGILNEEFAS